MPFRIRLIQQETGNDFFFAIVSAKPMYSIIEKMCADRVTISSLKTGEDDPYLTRTRTESRDANRTSGILISSGKRHLKLARSIFK